MYLGVDLGGTKIAAGLCDDEGRILRKGSIPTGVGRPAEEIMADMAALCRTVAEGAGVAMGDVAAVGVAAPGLIDPQTGEVVIASNLYWYHVQLTEYLSQDLGRPVFADNDANVAALAEVEAGSMMGAKDAILLTLGTGVGGGIIIDGRIYAGKHNGGAELGHNILVLGGEQCTCGNRGCLEQYASATALIREGCKAAATHPNGLISRQAQGNLGKITAKSVIDCSREGDPEAVRIFDEYIYALAMGIISLINIFEPEYIAIGGGISEAGGYLLDKLRQCVNDHLFYPELPHPYIVLAELGNDAGIIGAAMVAKAKIGQLGMLTQ